MTNLSHSIEVHVVTVTRRPSAHTVALLGPNEVGKTSLLIDV
jgi:ABC-type branched-subunit amino acid transport system ATPase component